MNEKISTTDIVNLFRYFTVAYTSKWTSAIEGMEGQALEIWYRELSGLTQQQLAKGLERCRHEEWPPSLPQFRMWCVDVPSLEDITRQVIHRAAEHPVAVEIAKQIGSWDLRHNSEEDNKKRIRSLYRDVVEQHVRDVTAFPLDHGEEMLAVTGKVEGRSYD